MFDEKPLTHKIMKISEEEYNAHPALRQSHLKHLYKSVANYLHETENEREDTSYFSFGRLVHAVIQEPETVEKHFPMFTGARRSGKAWEEFQEKHVGKTIVTVKDMDQAHAMRDAFEAHPATKSILDGADFETTVVWTDEETGIECKSRADIIKDRVIWDIKTTSKFVTFGQSLEDYYIPQPGWYLDGFKDQADQFNFIVIDKEAPHAIRIIEADAPFLKRSREHNRKALNNLAEYKKTGIVPPFAFEKASEII